ncbi:hypothetical protein JN531_004860 [Flagellatimonas centrodinii]|uniref:CC0125/CC1285 family lipoprotein n=1 Tax=Flagellatimonas centrodinii TaxID=2806210 RepID=UPI001FF0483B|nr:hypothetical protein [Flagellatimonas centrodinii]ULQ47618.1 hypothetical protein JN531_004860 [Flagellatimonas centrodinii]
MHIVRILPLLAATTLAACATATPYQPLTNGQGYADLRIEPNRHRVTFQGNSATERQTVENYLLLRAAELTIENGFDYFVMDALDTEADTRYTQSVSFGGAFGFYGGFPGNFGSVGLGTSNPVTKYQAQAFVVMYKGDKPADDTRAFNARAVRDSLAPLAQQPES